MRKVKNTHKKEHGSGGLDEKKEVKEHVKKSNQSRARNMVA